MNTQSQTITQTKTITLQTKLISKQKQQHYEEGAFCIMTGEQLTEDSLQGEKCNGFQVQAPFESIKQINIENNDQNNIQKQITITWEEVINHLCPESLWVIIFEQVYDFTDLISANDHFFSSQEKNLILKNLKNPKYLNNITILISTNPKFKSRLLEINQELQKRKSLIGEIEAPNISNQEKIALLETIASQNVLTKKEVAKNKWFIINGFVYDLKETFHMHPRGDYFYKKYVGQDCSEAFNEHEHPENVALTKCEYLVGKLADQYDEMDISKISNKSRLTEIHNLSHSWNGFQFIEEQNQQQNKQCSIF